VVKISVEIPDELDKRFRHAIIERLGSRKGALAIAIREGIELWMAQKETKPKEK
jgi:metal-responsive CopG/Arc/MetJ family transcriptional regulator